MTTNRAKLALCAAAVLALSACGSSSGSSSSATTTQQPTTAATVTAKYGTPQTVKTSAGDVEITVGAPEVVTHHAAAYDPTSPTSTKPGKALPPTVRVVVNAKGISGSVQVTTNISGNIAWLYEESNGTLAMETTDPAGAAVYEKTDPIHDHPTTLSAGQKTAGEMYFASGDLNGKTTVTGLQPVVWAP